MLEDVHMVGTEDSTLPGDPMLAGYLPVVPLPPAVGQVAPPAAVAPSVPSGPVAPAHAAVAVPVAPAIAPTQKDSLDEASLQDGRGKRNEPSCLL